MTTDEYINELEKDVQKLKIKESLENDSKKKAAIRKRIVKRSRLLNAFRTAFARRTINEDGVKYETTTLKE